MANVTDPLARPIHGTNPQNLIEYITRQRIYDSQYWKEHLFGCTAADVAEKAAVQLQAIGGTYGGNAKPSRFLCLVLKMLQIQPDEEIVDELINNENFKYVRALGAFYLRLTGRPADIYEKLEPLYNDYRKLKYRNPADWKLLHMDEFIDELFTNARVCGIALPRLPNRDVLVESGYLDGPRRSAVATLLDLREEDDDDDDAKYENRRKSVDKIELLLKRMAQDGNLLAQDALIERGHKLESSSVDDRGDELGPMADENEFRSDKPDISIHNDDSDKVNEAPTERESKKRKSNDKKKTKKKAKHFGSLFKKSPVGTDATNNAKTHVASASPSRDKDGGAPTGNDEQSEEYWNEERAKLGLKPLRK
jgi:pre-mRNA-splicing factor 38A